MYMKTIKIIIISLLVGLNLTSCDFLEKDPTYTTPENYFKNEADAASWLTGTYAILGQSSFYGNEFLYLVGGDDLGHKEPLRCILNGLGKDAAQIISRINGFTYVQTQFDYYTGELKVVREIAYSDGPRAKVKCYGADDVREGVAIMWKEGVDENKGKNIVVILPDTGERYLSTALFPEV